MCKVSPGYRKKAGALETVISYNPRAWLLYSPMPVVYLHPSSQFPLQTDTLEDLNCPQLAGWNLILQLPLLLLNCMWCISHKISSHESLAHFSL